MRSNPTDIYNEYIKLEHDFNITDEELKKTKETKKKKYLRNKKKQIRDRQNMLYLFLAEYELVNKLTRELGLKYQAIYMRYKRSEYYKKEQE